MGVLSRLLDKGSRPKGAPPGPASEAAIAGAESALGFPLPVLLASVAVDTWRTGSVGLVSWQLRLSLYRKAGFEYAWLYRYWTRP